MGVADVADADVDEITDVDGTLELAAVELGAMLDDETAGGEVVVSVPPAGVVDVAASDPGADPTDPGA